MSASVSDGQPDPARPPGEILSEILKYDWNRPVLQSLADGERRHKEIRAKLGDAAPGEGQINATLRVLANLGVVHKGDHKNDPWKVTELGRGTLADLAELDRLMAEDPDLPIETFNMSVAHPARRYNYWLGGKDNFGADRASGDRLEAVYPGMRAGIRAHRQLLRRVVRFMADELGIRQFLDVGTGLPTADNTHEVAQAVARSSRVVYVDNDPLVLSHARALLTSSPEGKTAYIDADAREPDTILSSHELQSTLDLSQPVGLLLAGMLHFIPGKGAAKPVVDRLMSPLAPGSHLFVTHATNDFQSQAVIDAHEQMRRQGDSDFWMRDKDEVTELFDGLEILPPGVVPSTKWRPEPGTPDLDLRVVNIWSAVARKPH